jgi:cyclophilin family peptidyl-prolyl cis-trans isomerase
MTINQTAARFVKRATMRVILPTMLFLKMSSTMTAQVEYHGTQTIERAENMTEMNYEFCNYQVDNTSAIVTFPCRPAEFGDKTVDDTNTGVGPYKNLMSRHPYPMILADPVDACVEPKEEQAQYAMKVVFVRRGGCSFYKKALNIMKGSQGTVAAIIIADNAPNPNGLISLVRGQKNRDKIEAYFSVPIVSMLHEDAQKLLELHSANIETFKLGMSFAQGWKDIEREGLIREHPDESDPAWWHNLAVAIANQGSSRRQDAIKALNRTHVLDNYESVSMLGKLLEEEGSYTQAFHTWKRAAKIAPDGASRMKCMEKAKEVYSFTFDGSEEQQVGMKKGMNARSDDHKELIAKMEARPFTDMCAADSDLEKGACTCKASPSTWQGGWTGWAEAKVGATPQQRTDVCCITTRGSFTIAVQPALAPKGAARFLDLVRADYFADMPMYGSGGMDGDPVASHVRFGIPADKPVHVRGAPPKWPKFEDDPQLMTGYEKGSISFRTMHGKPGSRDTQFMIASGHDLDEGWPFNRLMSHAIDLPPQYGKTVRDLPFAAPFGRVTHGLDILAGVYNPIGAIDTRIHPKEGNEYIKKFFPKMDYIKKCTIVGE